MDKINVFITSDDNYAQHLAVTIASILCNADSADNLDFYILDGGISETSKQKIKKLKKIKSFNIEFLKINDDDFDECCICKERKHTIATFYRLKIANLKPEFDKAIYLDSDIVVKKSLSELWNTDIKDYVMGVVEDGTTPKIKQENKKRINCDKYFNAGILLLNLNRWREIDAEKQCFELVKKEKDNLLWLDQDVLNILFQNDIKFLHPKWNLQTSPLKGTKYEYSSEKENKEALNSPCIIHYTTRFKPWSFKHIHPLESEYFKYLKKTEWRNFIFKYKVLSFKSFLSRLVKHFAG